MQLKLSENIKKYRKDMGLTQEELADALGVTIGAVSKWENGNNVPDIMMLMEIANFFNVSMDEFLGYDMSSKNMDDMCERISDLCNARKYEEAIKEANNALVRYPHNFKVIYACSLLYYLKAYEQGDDKDREKAIELLKRAQEFISQNKDPRVSEFLIKRRIAEMYTKSDPDKALELLKEINYDDCNSAAIAMILAEKDEREEALKYYNTALLKNFSEQYSILANASIAVAASCKRKDYQTAIDLINTEMQILKLYGSDTEKNYTFKLRTILLITKAWWLSCIRDYKHMEECVKEAYALAVKLDAEGVPFELSSSLKFYFSDDKAYFYDTVGVDAVGGIETMFERERDGSKAIGKNYDHMQKVIDCWNECKKNKA